MKSFLICTDIDTKIAMEFSSFLIDCKTHNEKALLIINSNSGNDSALRQIVAAYESSGVYLIAIGMGTLSNCSSAIFCMADERILLPGTDFSIHPNIKNYYGKTGITQEIFKQKCTNNTYWAPSEDEFEKYKIITRSSEGWMELVEETIEKNEEEFSNYFLFTSDFNSSIASDFVMFLIMCKIKQKNAFVVINSGGGHIKQLKAILNAYQASGVHLTAVGTGGVASCAAGLFCMADERILAPRTNFLLHHASTSVDKRTIFTAPIFNREYESMQVAEKTLVSAYISKTAIPIDVFESKCENGADWVLTEEEIQKYGITTRSSEGWLDILANALK